MLGPDSYYTPDNWADKLLGYVQGNPTTVADFCVGDGGLLLAAVHRFPNIACYGIDISREVIRSLRAKQPKWKLRQCDFKNEETIGKVPFMNGAKFKLIVLNPPFTCRGSKIVKVMWDGEEYHMSTALSFVMASLPYLADDGGLYAILPISCVYSQKDSKCWQYLQEHYHAQVLEVANKVFFKEKCYPNIVIVYLGKIAYTKVKGNALIEEFRSSVPIEGIHRGRLGIYQAKTITQSAEGRRFIHTTNMRKGELVDTKHVLHSTGASIKGNGVLIPRVCNPSPEKIVVFDGKESVLSDCVVLLKTRTKKQAVQLKKHLLDNWAAFSALYIGTGARYVTMNRLRTVFGLHQ